MASNSTDATPDSLHAVERTKKFLNSPVRLGVPTIIMATFLALLSLMQAGIIPKIWGWPIVIVLVICLAIAATAMNHRPQSDGCPRALSEPFRPNPNAFSTSSIAPAFMIPGVFVLSNAASALIPGSGSITVIIVSVIGAALVAALLTFPRKFGYAPIAFDLPKNFATRYPYAPDSAEAAVLGTLYVGGAPRRVVFRDCLPYFTALDDDTLTEALHRLSGDGLIRVCDNNTALTQKGRNRQLVMLEDAA